MLVTIVIVDIYFRIAERGIVILVFIVKVYIITGSNNSIPYNTTITTTTKTITNVIQVI